jgi:hypothetical protein
MDEELRYFGKCIEKRNLCVIIHWSTVSFFENRHNCSFLPQVRENSLK